MSTVNISKTLEQKRKDREEREKQELEKKKKQKEEYENLEQERKKMQKQEIENFEKKVKLNTSVRPIKQTEKNYNRFSILAK
jgi:hypothetical protein